MNIPQIYEPCPICGEGVAILRREVYLTRILFYRECNTCGSDYAGADESRLNALPHAQKVVLQSQLQTRSDV